MANVRQQRQRSHPEKEGSQENFYTMDSTNVLHLEPSLTGVLEHGEGRMGRG